MQTPMTPASLGGRGHAPPLSLSLSRRGNDRHACSRTEGGRGRGGGGGGGHGHARTTLSLSNNNNSLLQSLSVSVSASVSPSRAASVASRSSVRQTASDIFTDLNDAKTSQPLDTPTQGFDSIPTALAALRLGTPVVVLDDEDRENEGDLIVSGDRVTEETMAFIVKHTSGVICLGMLGQDLDRLEIPLMIPPYENEEAMSTAFTVTVDLREGTTTGISAADRVATVRALSSRASVGGDFKRPGHIFPLRARPGGVLVRPGHTEASVDLARLAGCAPTGVLCEIVSADEKGTMARTEELLKFSEEYGLPCITIADLIRYRLKVERVVQKEAEGVVETRWGPGRVVSYSSVFDDGEHVAVVFDGDRDDEHGVLTRVQNESILGDLLGGARCGARSEFDAALERIAAEGGVFVYVRGQKARGMGVADELRAFYGDEESASACEVLRGNDGGGFTSDVRDYAIAAQIFRDLGVEKMRLMTGNAKKADCLKAHGLAVTVERI